MCLELQIGKYSLIGCREQRGSLWRLSSKCGLAAVGNGASSSSHFHVEHLRREDLPSLGAAMAMPWLYSLHLALICLLRGEFMCMCVSVLNCFLLCV